MNKIILLLLSLSLISGSVMSKELSKEDKKRIKSQLKEYLKNPDSFQKMMDHNKQTIDSNTAELAQRKATIDQLSASFTITQKKVDDLESQLKECQNKPVQTCPPCPTPGVAPANGTVYKVQIGLYKKLDLSSYFAEPKYTGMEKVDGMNRYVFSYFNTKAEAEEFVADLRKLGLRGAFVAKYENGERIMEGKKAKTKSASKSTPKAEDPNFDPTTPRPAVKKKVPLKK